MSSIYKEYMNASTINKILSEYLKGNKKLAYVELKKISTEYPYLTNGN